MVKRRAGASGYVMIVAIFVLVITMTAAVLVAASIHRQSRMYLRERQQVELTTMTDAALAWALSTLLGDPGFEGEETLPFGGGSLEIEVSPDVLKKKKVRRVVVRAVLGASGRAAETRVCVDPDSDDKESEEWEECDGRSRPWVMEWKPIPYH